MIKSFGFIGVTVSKVILIPLDNIIGKILFVGTDALNGRNF